MSEKGPVYRQTIKDGLMAEKAGSRLPALDYRALMQARLDGIRRGAKAPGGKYENLLIYLKERSGRQMDAAELDRRMRTFFEDMITRVLRSPADYDQDVTLSGRALMDYLSGVPSPGPVGPRPEGRDGA